MFFCRMLAFWFLVIVVSFSNAFLVTSVDAKDAWYAPGCHKVGELNFFLNHIKYFLALLCLGIKIKIFQTI